MYRTITNPTLMERSCPRRLYKFVPAFLLIGLCDTGTAQNRPFVQFGLSKDLERADAISLDLLLGYTIGNPVTHHNFSTLIERAQEANERSWLAGLRYGASFPFKDKYSIALSAEGKWDLSHERHDLILEENLQLGYDIAPKVSVQVGTALQFSQEYDFQHATPEINMNINYEL
jgi:hypothetical protein